MRAYPKRLEGRITEERYGELAAECENYPRWLFLLSVTIQCGGCVAGTVHSGTGNPTEHAALERIRLGDKCQEVELVCMAVMPEGWGALLKYVTNKTVTHASSGAKCGKDEFFDRVAEFYVEYDKSCSENLPFSQNLIN